MKRLVLASQSPRRKLLLEGLGFSPIVRPADVPEVRRATESPREYTRRLSLLKANTVATKMAVPSGGEADETSFLPWVLAADTVVVLDGELLEKPGDEEEAVRMLGRLSGNWHRVITSFSICEIGGQARSCTETVEADVHIRALTLDEIRRYVATGEPMDKAGAYGIQAVGGFLVREVRGSYFAVVGLPVCEVVESLLAVGAIDGYPLENTRSYA